MKEKYLTCTKYFRRGDTVVELEVQEHKSRFFCPSTDKWYFKRTCMEVTPDFIKDRLYHDRETVERHIEHDKLCIWIWETFRDLKYYRDFDKLKKIKEIWESS